jgi:hypothetical protein
MAHAEFVAAYQSGSIRVNVDRARAARFVSARLLLPLVMLPVLGTGVALALVGWIWSGLLVIAAGTFLPVIIKRSAPHFIITQALHDIRFYEDAAAEGLLEIEDQPSAG